MPEITVFLQGRRFGRLMVMERISRRGHWRCLCDCGTEKVALTYNLKSGATASCGCLQRERASETSGTHRKSAHPVYKAWVGMKNRCTNQNAHDFKHYGGRGIRICEAWADPKVFLADMLPTWRRGLTLERNDVNGNYAPDNCSWITRARQARNQRRTVRLDTPWGRMCLHDAAERSGLSPACLRSRLRAGRPPGTMFIPR